MKVEQTDYSETPAYKIQAPGNYPEESMEQYDHVKCDATWLGKFSPTFRRNLVPTFSRVNRLVHPLIILN